MLNTTKSSGWTWVASDLYAIAKAQPPRSSKPGVDYISWDSLQSQELHTVSMEPLGWLTRAGVVATLLVTTWPTGPVRSSVLVASKLSGYLSTRRERHNIVRMRGLVKMPMEPPLVEWQALEWGLRTVVAASILGRVGSSDIETVHGRMPDSYFTSK